MLFRSVAGLSPVSAPIYFYAFSVVGQTVRVEGSIPLGLVGEFEFERVVARARREEEGWVQQEP